MAELFQRDRSTIQRHIKRIYEEGELAADSTCALFAQVQKEGNREVERKIPIYILDMIIRGCLKMIVNGSEFSESDNDSCNHEHFVG